MPQAALMPSFDLVVHHGGAGTVLDAAAHGIPQILLPQGADHHANAAAVTAAGIGRAFTDPLPDGALAEAAVDLLGHGPERDRAASLRRDIAQMPSPDDVAARLLGLVANLENWNKPP